MGIKVVAISLLRLSLYLTVANLIQITGSELLTAYRTEHELAFDERILRRDADASQTDCTVVASTYDKHFL